MTADPAPGAVRPADRYGDRTSPVRRRLGLAAVALLVVTFLGWLLWAAAGAADRDVRWDDVGYVIVDDTTVEVTFSVVKDPGATAVCTLQALNSQYGQVGLTTVEVGPAPEAGVVRTATVRTAERAVTGLVDSCQPA